MTRIRMMTSADVAFGLHLSEQAGWNQIEADWRRALDLGPDGCFIAKVDGESVGTVTTCVLGTVGWVALLLVDEKWRGRGVGRALFERSLAHLDSCAVTTVRLDATPLGQPLYEQFGFEVQYRLARFEGVLPVPGDTTEEGVVAVSPDRWEELYALDQSVTQTDRRLLLRRLFEEGPEDVLAVEAEGKLVAFATTKPGRRALQVGPCLGEAAEQVLAEVCRRHAGQQVYLDVPVDNGAAVALAGRKGLTVQRHLTRMYRGEEVRERLVLYWTGSGPAKG